MMQIFSGTIKNAVKLDMLTQDFEQKKSTNQLMNRTERNARANMSQEERMLEQFKKELEQNREQSRNTDIANKIMNGEDLTPEEERYLAQKNPGQLSNYRHMKEERKAYEEKLQKCKTKDEVQRLKTETMSSYLAELKSTPGSAKAAKAVEIIGKVRNVMKAEAHFIKSGEYAKLPTEADEAIERSEERMEEYEEMLEEVKESVSPEEEDITPEEATDDENFKVEKKAEDSSKGEKSKDKEIDGQDDKHKESKVKKKKDPLDEIEEICSRYIPNINGGPREMPKTEKKAPEPIQPGNKVDIIL